MRYKPTHRTPVKRLLVTEVKARYVDTDDDYVSVAKHEGPPNWCQLDPDELIAPPDVTTENCEFVPMARSTDHGNLIQIDQTDIAMTSEVQEILGWPLKIIRSQTDELRALRERLKVTTDLNNDFIQQLEAIDNRTLWERIKTIVK